MTGYIYAAMEPECITVNREPDESYKRFNFDLCRAIDLTKLGIVLDKMVKAGFLDEREAELLDLQASALLATMRTANNRALANLRAKGGGNVG